MRMALDLTRAGYGPTPASTLTWRQFWYTWATLYLREEREKRERETFQMWLAGLGNAPEGATQRRLVMDISNARTSAFVAQEIRQVLPLSVRALLAVPDVAKDISTEADAIQWYEDMAEQYADDPDDKRADFFRAGKEAILQRHTVH